MRKEEDENGDSDAEETERGGEVNQGEEIKSPGIKKIQRELKEELGKRKTRKGRGRGNQE